VLALELRGGGVERLEVKGQRHLGRVRVRVRVGVGVGVGVREG
tara:strand:- start:116 stop:244 length:129 start_codon:yes stop_codon:yes gene_type:complete